MDFGVAGTMLKRDPNDKRNRGRLPRTCLLGELSHRLLENIMCDDIQHASTEAPCGQGEMRNRLLV